MAKKKIDALVHQIRLAVPRKNGLLVPISGGSDSALAFWLCAKALPDRTVGVYMGDKLREKEWFSSFGRIKNLKPVKSGQNPEILRWSYFLELSLKENRILVGTRNRTENVLGTYSLASRVAWFLPIIGLWKTDVLALCRFIGVPEEIIKSSSRPDVMCGRPEELAEIPIDLIDTFSKFKAGELPKKSLKALTGSQVGYLESLYEKNSFKRNLPVELD